MYSQLTIPKPMGTVTFNYDEANATLWSFCKVCLEQEKMPHPMAVEMARLGSWFGRRRRVRKAKKAEKRAYRSLRILHYFCRMRS